MPGIQWTGKVTSSELAAAFPKIRTEKPAGYPERFPVDAQHASWDVPMPDYQPRYHVDPKVIAQHRPGGWAEPEDFRAVSKPRRSCVGPLRTDAQGRPLNPMGRTGIEGRGLLGKWGPNPAADPMVLWWDGVDVKMLLIQRKEVVVHRGNQVHPWAIPGGMADEGEAVSGTLARELLEETGIALDLSEKAGARVVYQGPVDDPRSTDHAWIETTAAYQLLSADDGKRVEAGMKAMDDAVGVQAVVLNRTVMETLYASHGGLVTRALRDLLTRSDVDERIQARVRAVLDGTQ